MMIITRNAVVNTDSYKWIALDDGRHLSDQTIYIKSQRAYNKIVDAILDRRAVCDLRNL